MTTRTTRESTSRSTQERKKSWTPPNKLAAPEPKEGFKHRWVRRSVRNEPDDMNVVSRIRQGYEPVRAEDHPDFIGTSIPEGESMSGIISVGDLILTEVPIEVAEQRQDHFEGQAKRMEEAVNQDLERHRSRYTKIYEESDRTRVEYGNQEREVSFQKED